MWTQSTISERRKTRWFLWLYEEVAVAVRPEVALNVATDRANPATPYRVDSSGEECGSGTVS